MELIPLKRQGNLTIIARVDQIGAVESVKAASDIFAPVSGVIDSVNTALDEKPSTVNAAAETDGLLSLFTCLMRTKSLADFDGYCVRRLAMQAQVDQRRS